MLEAIWHFVLVGASLIGIGILLTLAHFFVHWFSGAQAAAESLQFLTRRFDKLCEEVDQLKKKRKK